MGEGSLVARRIREVREAKRLAAAAAEVEAAGPEFGPAPTPPPDATAFAACRGDGMMPACPVGVMSPDCADGGVVRGGLGEGGAAEPSGARAEGGAGTTAPSVLGPPLRRIVDAPTWLPREAPATLIRDADGLIRIEAPHPTALAGRRRHDVDAVLLLPGIGQELVGAMFARAPGCVDTVWKRYAAGANSLAAALRGLGLASTSAPALPRDLFARVEAWRRERDGVADLPVGARVTFNTARWLVGAIGACAHVDVSPDRYQGGLKADWRMEEGAPAPVASTLWGDTETERLLKRCSVEVLARVASWNQFVAHLDGRVVEGPCDPRELALARDLVRLDPACGATPARLAMVPGAAEAMLELGWESALGIYAAEAAGEAVSGHAAEIARTVAKIGRVERVSAASFRYGKGLPGVLRLGWERAVRVAFPTAEGMAPCAALLAVQSRLNPSPLGSLGDEEFGLVEAEPARDPEGGDGRGRLMGAAWKGRSHRFYHVDLPVTLEPDDPAPVHAFVKSWTAHVREAAGRYSGSLFIYLYDFLRGPRVGSFANYDYYPGFPTQLHALCDRAGVPRITPRELRRIGIDIIHDACDGDPVTMKAAGDWRDLKTGRRHYFGPSIALRGQESLMWALKIEARRLDHGIEVIGRPRGADLFAATDGFRCGNPLDGPDPQESGEICHASGMCPICPHADADAANPAWTFARMVALADHVAVRIEAGAEPAWVARYGPGLDELLELWLPLAPDDVVEAARLLPQIEFKELPI